MTAAESAVRAPVPAVPALLLLAGFAAAVALRVAVGGLGVAQSPRAGLVFAAALAALATASRVPVIPRLGAGRGSPVRPRIVAHTRAGALGLVAAAVLCLPVWLLRPPLPWPASTGLAAWATPAALVAVAEEAFLRGALYRAVTQWRGSGVAVGLGALAFALMHVPLYGWRAVPLDLAVGLLLGELRRQTGTVTAPAVTHVTADLAAWFLRA